MTQGPFPGGGGGGRGGRNDNEQIAGVNWINLFSVRWWVSFAGTVCFVFWIWRMALIFTGRPTEPAQFTRPDTWGVLPARIFVEAAKMMPDETKSKPDQVQPSGDNKTFRRPVKQNQR